MIPNRARLYDIIYKTTKEEHERYNIGTYKEKKLHVILKKYFEPEEDYHEVPTNGFIADVRRDNEIIEIETSGFSGLKPKLEAYLPEYHVTLVHPLAAKKYVSWIDSENGGISDRKPSPKKENIYDLLFELIYILPYVKSPNLTIAGPLLEIDEYKILGKNRQKRWGTHRYERIPVDIYGIITLSTDEDYAAAVPDGLNEQFTVLEFAKGAKIKRDTAYAVLKVLCERGVVEQSGKRGNAGLYSRINRK